MSSILNKAQSLDFYALQPSLAFGKEGKVYSRLGLTLTLVTVLAIGSLLIYQSVEVFGRRKPDFIQYSLRTKAERIPFDFSQFFLMIFTSNNDDDSEYYSVKASNSFSDSDNDIAVSFCSNEISTKGHCFSQNKDRKGGIFLGDGRPDALEATLSACELNSGCASPTEMNTFLDQTYAFVVYSDWVVDPTNFEEPLKADVTFSFEPFSSTFGKTLVLTLEYITFISDDGWFFESLRNETRIRISSTKTEVRASGNKYFSVKIQYGETTTVYKRTYPKVFDLISQVYGTLGTVIAVFFVFISPYTNLRKVQHLVNEGFEVKQLNNQKDQDSSPKSPDTAGPTATTAEPNSPFKTKRKRPEKKKVPPLHQSKTATIQSSPEHVIDIPQREDNIRKHVKTLPPIQGVVGIPPQIETLQNPIRKYPVVKNPIEDEDEMPAAEDSPGGEDSEEEEGEEISKIFGSEDVVPMRGSQVIDVGWKEWVSSLWKPQPQVRILKEAEKRISNLLDLVTLSKKIVEIDKLKACLLTHEQRVLFDNLPSSVIVLDATKDIKSKEAVRHYYWKQSYRGDEEKLKQAYWKTKGGEKLDKIDKRLLTFYENEYMEDQDAVIRKLQTGIL